MVLVMVTDVVCQCVERSVVRKGFRDGDLESVPIDWLRLLEDVVFGNEVACAGVQGPGQEGTHDQIPKGIAAHGLHQRVIEGELGGDIEGVDIGQREVVNEHGSERVEEDLKGSEEGLSQDRIEEEGFEASGEVSVETVDTEGFVVGQMVGL